MTIDEAIAEEKEKAKEQKTKYDKCPTRMRYCCEMCFHKPKCNEVAEEHKQIAEWLEELKSYRASVFSGYMTQKMLKEEYNKAIDDFVTNVKEHQYLLSDVINSKDYGMFTVGIEQIAEQLKEGGENDNLRK